MKSIYFYEAIKIINKTLFQEQNIIRISKALIVKLKVLKNNCTDYDKVKEVFNNYYDTQHDIEDRLNKTTNNYFLYVFDVSA